MRNILNQGFVQPSATNAPMRLLGGLGQARRVKSQIQLQMELHNARAEKTTEEANKRSTHAGAVKLAHQAGSLAIDDAHLRGIASDPSHPLYQQTQPGQLGSPSKIGGYTFQSSAGEREQKARESAAATELKLQQEKNAAKPAKVKDSTKKSGTGATAKGGTNPATKATVKGKGGTPGTRGTRGAKMTPNTGLGEGKDSVGDAPAGAPTVTSPSVSTPKVTTAAVKKPRATSKKTTGGIK